MPEWPGTSRSRSAARAAAVEYVHIARLNSRQGGGVAQYVLGAVYHPRPQIGYSLQTGPLIGGQRTGWNTTVGVSVLI